MKLSEILTRLHEPIPSSLISQKRLKGSVIDYVAWFDLADLLDERCGFDGWEWKVSDVMQVGNRLTLTGTLTVYGDDKSLSRDATGCEDVDCSSFGDPSSNSEAMALRRCCAKFGLGRDLWRKDKEPQKIKSEMTNFARPNKMLGKSETGEISREEWLRRKTMQEAT